MADFFFGFDTSLAVSKQVPLGIIFSFHLCLKIMKNVTTRLKDCAWF